jgi:hypothetical protein
VIFILVITFLSLTEAVDLDGDDSRSRQCIFPYLQADFERKPWKKHELSRAGTDADIAQIETVDYGGEVVRGEVVASCGCIEGYDDFQTRSAEAEINGSEGYTYGRYTASIQIRDKPWKVRNREVWLVLLDSNVRREATLPGTNACLPKRSIYLDAECLI